MGENTFKLGDICRIELGKTPSRSNKKFWGENKSSTNIWLSIADLPLSIKPVMMDSKEYITDEGAELCKVVPKNTLIVSFKLSLGRLAITGCDLYTNEAIAALYINEGVELDQDYLYWYLTFFDWDAAAGSDIKVKGKTLNKAKLKEIIVPIPSLPEQKRIVALLDTVFTDLEKTRAKTEQNLKNARELFDNYLQQIFTKKGDGWVETTLGKLCEKMEYGTSSKSESDGDIPVLRMGNIQCGILDWEKLKYTSNKDDIDKLLLKENDVLFNRTNSPELVGKSAIYRNEMPAIFAGYLIRIHRKEDLLDANYLNYYLNSNFARTFGFSIMSHSTNQANINGTKLKSYPINIPNIVEQSNFGNRFRELELEIIKIESIYKKKLLKIDELKKSILQKAFSGELTQTEQI